MKSEYKYFAFYVSILLGISAIFSLLFYKYTYLSLFHFAQICSQSLSSFFNSWYHVVGFSILLTIICLIGYLFLKFIFSTVKTENKKTQFISSQLSIIPKNIVYILDTYSINQENVVFVKKNTPLAFTLGFFSQKIVLTTGLYKKLTTRELEAVILHEHYHLKHNHGFIILVAKLVSSTFFFLPFLNEIYLYMKALFEYKADDHAKSVQKTKLHLITSINKISNHTHTFEFVPGFAICTVKERLARLHGIKEPNAFFSVKQYLLTIPIMVLLIVLFALPINAHTIDQSVSDSDSPTSAKCQNTATIKALQQMSVQLNFSPAN